MGFSDDEFYDDDVYYDDDDDVNDLLDDDDEEVSSSSATNPFSRRSSGLPGSERSGFSGRSSSSGGGSSPFNRGGSSGGSSSFRRGGDDDKKDDSSSKPGPRFGGGGGGGSFSGSSFRRGGDDKKSDTGPLRSSFGRSDDDKKDDPSSRSSSRFGGSGSSSGSSSFRRSGDDDKKDDPSSRSSSRFGGSGSSSGSSSFRRGGDDKKDDSGAKKSGFGGFGRRGGDDKKDDSSSKSSSRFGGFGRGRGDDKKDDASNKSSSRFGGFGRGGDDKKDDSGAKKSSFGGIGRRGGGDHKKDDSGGGLLGGITSSIGGMFGRGGDDDKKDDSRSGRPGGFGRGGDDSRSSGSQRSAFGARKSSGDAGGKESGSKSRFGLGRGKDDSSKKDRSADGEGFLSRINPFGGGGEKKQRTSKTRASKIPKTADGGFELDLDAKLDILGVVLVFGGLILFISSLSADQGSITGWFNDLFVSLFGWGALAGPVVMFAIGMWLIVRHFGDEPPEIDLVRLSGVILLFLGLLMTMVFIETFSEQYSTVFDRASLLAEIDNSVEAGAGGGAIGAEMYKMMVQNVGEIGAVFAILGWYVIGIMLATRTSAAEIAVFVISVWRSFQIAMQRRAQRRRAQRMAQMEAQQAAQLSVSKPAAAELGAGASGALPAPEEGEVPIEDRPIPIRMGGQMVTSRQEEPVEAGQQGAVGSPPASIPEEDSSGLFGGIAARLRKATPSLPFSTGDDEGETEEKTPVKAGEQDDSSGGLGAAAASAVGAVTTLGGLLGSRGNGDEGKQAEMPAPLEPSEPIKPPQPSSLPPAPDRTKQAGLFGGDRQQTPATRDDSPFRRASSPATQPDSPAQPAARSTPPKSEGSPSRFGVRPAASVAPAPEKEKEEEVQEFAPEDVFTPRPRPSGNAFGIKPASTTTPPRSGSEQRSGRLPDLRPQSADAEEADEDQVETTSEPDSPEGVLPMPTGSDRMSRLEQIRAGQARLQREAAIDDDEEDEDEEDEVVAASPAQNPFAASASKPSRFRFEELEDDEDDEDDDFELDDLDDEDDEEQETVAAEPAKPRSFGGSSPAKTFTPPTAAAGTPARVPESAPRSDDKPQQAPPRPAASSAPPPPAPSAPAQPVQPAQQPAASKQAQQEQPAASTPEPVINPVRPRPQAQPVAVEGGPRRWRLPDYRTLLASGSDQEFDRDGLVRRARIIEETLQSFGAPGRVVEINTGPVITQFGVEPDYLTARGGKKNRVKVGAIAALDKDLQLALGAKSIRVEAPVPGKGYVGIEVPNEEASLVSLRDVMESNEFTRITSPLAIALGMSVDGTPVAADLTTMPHLLIAGTTGSGKSVCVNSIITSLLVRNTPETVKFIMVDPKRVELTSYNNLPHLVAPVVVELERIVGVLKWVTREMDERYKRFSNAGARNIVDYNNNLPAGAEIMPYIIVIIDELADLMMLAPDETERVVTRIAALARATGIHLVIATQRPSVDVVTGLIKANFPARIAFAVAGGVDSRVILDQPGAERLLGKGDMLYMSPDSPAPLRLQGVFVSDMEIGNISRFWKSQDTGTTQQKPITALVMDDSASPQGRSVIPRGDRFVQSPPPSTQQGQRAFWDNVSPANPDVHSAGYGMSEREREQDDDERDELYGEAVELVRRLNKASVSLLQRRLRIGYTRAARLIDIMEAEGIVGPPTEGSKPREVLPAKK